MAASVKPEPNWWEAAPRAETEQVALPEPADFGIGCGILKGNLPSKFSFLASVMILKFVALNATNFRI